MNIQPDGDDLIVALRTIDRLIRRLGGTGSRSHYRLKGAPRRGPARHAGRSCALGPMSASNDADLRADVVDALMASGLSRAVALEKTNTTAKMLTEGERLNIC